MTTLSATSPAASTAAPLLPMQTTGFLRIAGFFRFIGIAALILAVIGLFIDPVRNGKSWLIGYGFWFAGAIGILMLVQISYIFDAGWSTIIRRQWEHALAAIPWLFALFLPVLIIPLVMSVIKGTPTTWLWMDSDALVPGGHGESVGTDILYTKKSAFLNTPFFIIRVVGYFGVLSLLAFLFRHFSFDNDRFPAPANYSATRKLAAVGVPLTALTLTFAAFDWFMSLSYHWFSTMYGVWFFATSMRTGLALTVILCFFLSSKGYLKGIMTPSHFYMIGCMKLAFTVFWAYIVFSQFFLIYNANIPEETFWYNLRQLTLDGERGSWWNVSMVLIFFNFLAPFLMLLFYPNKVISWRLCAISVWILCATIVDLYYNILPGKILSADDPHTYTLQEFAPNIYDFASLVGVGSICIWALLKSMSKAAPIPYRDPRVAESIHFHH